MLIWRTLNCSLILPLLTVALPRILGCDPRRDWGGRRAFKTLRVDLLGPHREIHAREDCRKTTHSLCFSAMWLEKLNGLDLRGRYRSIRNLSEGVRSMTALFPTKGYSVSHCSSYISSMIRPQLHCAYSIPRANPITEEITGSELFRGGQKPKATFGR